MKVNLRKRRLESSSEEEDEAVKEIKRLTNKVKGLEAILASKSKESTKKEREQLKEERKQVQEGKNKLEKMKTKVEEDRVKVEELDVKVEEEKIKLEMEKVKIEEERVKVEMMLKEQQRLVECPVCLAMPRENRAVPCCPQGHFVCSSCKDQLTRQGKLDCPTCRMPMGQGQSLLALTVVKNAQHECRLQGCNMSVPFEQIREHEEKCIWRLVICPGSICTEMIPLCTVLNHVPNCPSCVWPPVKGHGIGVSRRNFLMLDKARAFDGKSVSWKTDILQLEPGGVFFVRRGRKGDVFMIEVVMMGSKEGCKEFMVEASILDTVSGKSMFKSTFQPRPMANQNEAVFCLSVPERAVSEVWKYNMLKEKYRIEYLVKVVKLG